jgi:CRP-like cAMP-binding protein
MYAFLTNHFLFLHIAGLISFAALALKDQLKLRTVLLASIVFNILFHMRDEHGPQWQELFWNTVEFLINSIVITQLVMDKTHIGLNAESEELFNAFKFLSPGEFRALLKLGKWEAAHEEIVLTTEGVLPTELFYILRGAIHIHKGDAAFTIAPRTFIGEVAFLHGTPASATVRLEPGARYLRWPAPKLQKALQSKDALRVAVMRVISLDTAAKVARSGSHGTPSTSRPAVQSA